MAAPKPMKLAVFGATGGTGIEVCKQAVARGHEVTAYVRSPEKLMIGSPNLTKVQGDLSDAAAIEGVVKGKDAVLCALGGRGLLSRDTTCSVGTRAIIAAMDKEGVKRLVVCSSLGCPPENRVHVPWVVRFILTYPLLDKDEQEADIMKSDLDYTIVRPPQLVDAPIKEGDPVAQEDPKVPVMKISRAEVAAFMLKVVEDGSWVRKGVHVSWKP